MKLSPLKRLALAAFSLFLFLSSCELGLQLVPQAIPIKLLREFQPGVRSAIAARRQLLRRADTVAIPRSDGGPAERLWRFQPGIEVTKPFDEEGIVETVRVDNNGFCNVPADAYESPRFDVVTIGDSFTWCMAVNPEDAWPAQLAKITGLRIYNLGLPGRGLHEYLETLRAFGLQKLPQIVVMNVYEGNDLRDAWFNRQQRSDADRSVTASACPFASETSCERFEEWRESFIGRASYGFNLVLAGTWFFAASQQEGEIDFRYDVHLPEGNVVTFNSQNGDRDEVLFARRLAEGTVSTDLFDDPLKAYSELAREHGFEAVLTYTPSAYTAYEALSEFQDPSIGSDLREYSRRLRRYFARRAGELGLHFVDLTPALQAAAAVGGDKLYFRTNVHYAQRGGRVVAAELAGLVSELVARRAKSGAWESVQK